MVAGERQIYQAASEGESTWSTVSYETKTTLTFTPDANATYLILFTALLQESSTLYYAGARLYNNTTATVLSEQIYQPKDATDYMHVGGAVYETFGASPVSQTYYIQFATSSASGTARIKNARIIAIKLTSADKYNLSVGESTTTSTSYSSKVTLTFTPASQGDYLIIGSAIFGGSSTGYDVRTRLYLDGTTAYGTSNVEPITSDNRYPYLYFQKVTLTAAEHTINLQWSSENTGATAGIANAYVIALRLDEFLNSYSVEQDTEQSAASETNVLSLSSASWKSSVAHLVLFSALITSKSTNNSVNCGLHEYTDTDLGYGSLEMKDTSNYQTGFNIYYTTSPVLNSDGYQCKLLGYADDIRLLGLRLKYSSSFSTPTKGLVYRVKFIPSTKQKTLAYKVKSSPSAKTKPMVYVVEGVTTPTYQRTLAYRVKFTPSTYQRTLVYRVKFTPSTYQRTLAYKVLWVASTIEKALAYKVLSESTDQKGLVYKIFLTSTIQKGLVYRIFSTPTVQKGLVYRVLKAYSATKDLKYTVPFNYTVQKGLDYCVPKWYSETKFLVYKVLTIPSTVQKTLAFKVKTSPSTVQKALAYKVLCTSSPTKDLDYTVLTTHTIQKGMEYDVQVGYTIQKDLVYKILSIPLTVQKEIAYRILTIPSTIQKDLDYIVLNMYTIEKGLVYKIFFTDTIQKGLEYVIPSPPSTVLKAMNYSVLVDEVTIYKKIGGGDWEAINTVPFSDCSAIDNGPFTYGVTYHYKARRVQTINGGDSVYLPMSNEDDVIIYEKEIIQKGIDYKVFITPSIQKTLVYRVLTVPSTIQKDLDYAVTPLHAPWIDSVQVLETIEISWWWP